MENTALLYTEEDVAYLRGRWLNLHSGDLGVKYWGIFDKLYREPQRHYHNFYHLRRLYSFFDEDALPILAKFEDPKFGTTAFEYSLWFHDVVYDPKRKDNEEKSAEMFKEFAKEQAIDAPLTELVNDIIMATTNHQLPEKLQGFHRDIASVFLDADLSVLGQTE